MGKNSANVRVVAAVLAALLLVMTACSGASPENVLEAAANAGGADIDDLELGENGEFDFSLGDAEVSFGGGAGRPDWLEPQFVLPDGLDIQIAIDDPSTGERAIVGEVEGGDAVAVFAQQAAALTAAGYEHLGESGTFVAPGRPPIEITVEQSGTGAYFSFEHRFETEQVLRDAYAPVEGTGSMAVTLGDVRYLFEGPCSLRSASGQFETSGDITNGQGSVTVELREGEQNYILASITTIDGETFGQWDIVQQDDAGNYPAIALDGRGFTVEGTMLNWADGTKAPVLIGVACPG